MISSLLQLLKTIVCLPVTLPVTLWRGIEETVRHQTLVKRLDEVTAQMLETRQQISAEQVRLALCTDDASAAVAREAMAQLLMKELQLNRHRLAIRRQIVNLSAA